MTEQLKKELIEETKKGNVYDWLCNHHPECSTYELVNIAKEIAYALYSVCINHLNTNETEQVNLELANEIDERVFTE